MLNHARYVQDNKQGTELSNWEYFAGDSLSSHKTIHQILHSAHWVPIRSVHELPNTSAGKALWLRMRLPEWNGTSPSLYMGQASYPLQMFFNETLIYELGDASSNTSTFIGWNQTLVQLPCIHNGDFITLCIQTPTPDAGIGGTVLLSSYDAVLKTVLDANLESLIFAVVFFALGIVTFIAYVVFRRSKLLLGITACLIPVSIFIVVNSTLIQMLYQAPKLYYHVDYLSFIGSSIGGFFAIAQVMTGKYKTIVRCIWYAHFLMLIATVIIIHFTAITYLDILPIFLLMLTINMILCAIVMMLSVRTGEFETKLLVAGMAGLFFFGMLEIAFYYIDGPNSGFGYNVRVVHYGVLLFVVSLIGIAAHKYFNANRQKETARHKELEAVKRENEAREQFSMRLIESQEQERNRIALELHDSVGQKVLLIKNQLAANIRKEPTGSTTDSLRKISDLTGEAIQEIRSISQNLRPQHLDQLGLTTAIETLVEQVQGSSDIRFHSQLENIDGLIPTEQEINFFRILQEAINNIVKHSHATEAFVTITNTNDVIHLEVRDNGTGFTSTGHSSRSGLGLTGMQERARMIGATLTVDLSKQTGSSIQLDYHLQRHVYEKS